MSGDGDGDGVWIGIGGWVGIWMEIISWREMGGGNFKNEMDILQSNDNPIERITTILVHVVGRYSYSY